MINGQTVLGVILARGGSKGVPKKNIKILAKKPLIGWTIEAARNSKILDKVVVSTDDPAIVAIAREYGAEVPFMRPKDLARDRTPYIDVMLHAIGAVPGYSWIVMLQPTSPLRTSRDIDDCIRFCLKERSHAAVSVTLPDKSPYWMYYLDNHQRMRPVVKMRRQIVRRQELPVAYALNGAVYVATPQFLIKHRTYITQRTVGFVMPRERSFDIDTLLDFQIAEHMIQSR